MEDPPDDLMIALEVVQAALSDDPIETDEEQILRLKKLVDNCSTGQDLYNCVTTQLPISGQKFGTSLSMNRTIVYLKSQKLCDEKCPTWANSKKKCREVIEKVYVTSSPEILASLKACIHEGFITKKATAAKIKRVHQVLILDDQNEQVSETGKPIDRIALLACALVDPDLLPMFTEISAPIDVALRPAFLDLGAIHVTLAKWTRIAEAIIWNLERVYSDT